MYVIYGIKKFSKFMGYYGPIETCSNCKSFYSPAYCRIRMWFNIYYIPLFPTRSIYVKYCPVCGAGVELKKKEAKPLMVNKNEMQHLYTYARYIALNKSYELWVRDLVSNKEGCIYTGLLKDQIKNIKFNRGLKKLDIINVN